MSREKKIERIVDDGMSGAGQKNLPALLFFARIKIQAPCVHNNVHCICHSMFWKIYNNIEANDENVLNTKRKRKTRWQYGDYR